MAIGITAGMITLLLKYWAYANEFLRRQSLATSVHEMPANPRPSRISRALSVKRRSQTT